ncbi:MAG: hypothetical protein WAV95_20275 [Azonexus sp.]
MKTSQLVIAALALLLSPCSQQASAAGEARLEWVIGIPWGEGNVDGVGEAARFAGPLILAADPRGGLLLSDHYANTVRRADADFRVTTLAGQSGVRAFRDGEAHAARFAWPAGLAAGRDGSIYVAEQDNNVIRKIAPDGRVSLLTGNPGQSGNSDGRGSRARFNRPMAVAVDAEHRLWVADKSNDAVRVVSPSGYVTTWPAKSATSEAADGMPENTGDTSFPGIEFLAFAPDGSLVVAGEWGVSRIKGGQARRLLNLTSEDRREEIISAFSSVPEDRLTPEHAAQLLEAKRQGARISEISGLAVRADGTIFLSDKSQGLVFELMSDGTPRVIAGRTTEERHNGAEGPAASALLNEPGSLAFDRQGRLFVANKSMSVQQILPDGEVRNVLGLANWYRKRDFDPASLPHGSADVAVENDQGEIFVVHRLSDEIHQFDARGRHLRQFGKNTDIGAPASATHVDGEAEQSRFRYPQDIALGRAGELFVADGSGIRRIGPDGKVSSLVVGARTPQRQDGSFEEARFFNPYRLAFDGKRYLYVLDNSPYAGGGGAPEVVRQLDLETQQISTVVDLNRIAEAYAQLPPEALPMFGPELRDIACGPGGHLYVLGKHGDLYTWTPDAGLKIAHLPDRLTPAGEDGAEEVIRNAEGKKVENNLIRSATLSGWTEHLAVDAAGNAYMTDSLADLVLRLDPAGNLEIIAGTPGRRGNVAGPLPGSLEYPEGLSITPTGDLLITVMYSGVIRIRQPQQLRGQRVVPREPGPAQ